MSFNPLVFLRRRDVRLQRHVIHEPNDPLGVSDSLSMLSERQAEGRLEGISKKDGDTACRWSSRQVIVADHHVCAAAQEDHDDSPIHLHQVHVLIAKEKEIDTNARRIEVQECERK